MFRAKNRFAHLDYDVRRQTLRRSKNKMAAVLELKINNYISATRIRFFLHNSDNRKYFTWVLIRMCTVVMSSDMTSFVYIDDEKHPLSKWLGKEKK